MSTKGDRSDVGERKQAPNAGRLRRLVTNSDWSGSVRPFSVGEFRYLQTAPTGVMARGGGVPEVALADRTKES